MSMLPSAAIRLRLDPLNPGHFFACCGVLELADRCWGGAEGWFEEQADIFCVAPLERNASLEYGARALFERLTKAELTNTLISEAQMKRREELSAVAGKARSGRDDVDSAERHVKDLSLEREALEALWKKAKDAALQLGAPFDLRLDWYLDKRAGAGRFKTWAGQQCITDIAFGLKNAVVGASLEEAEFECLFWRAPCASSLHVDASGDGGPLDVGFSFDPLGIRSSEKRPLVELLAFIGLQRFSPREVGEDGVCIYAAWFDPLLPQTAHAVARGFGAGPTRIFEFRLLYRTDYLKSFLPAQSRRDHL